MVDEPPTEVLNTDAAQLFVWTTQCSARGTMFRKRYKSVFSIYVLRGPTTIISIPCWFRNRSLIVTYVARCTSYPPDHSEFLTESWFISIFICCLIMHRLRISSIYVEGTKTKWRKSLRCKLAFEGVKFPSYLSFKVISFKSVLPND